jgi:hypothetical protein
MHAQVVHHEVYHISLPTFLAFKTYRSKEVCCYYDYFSIFVATDAFFYGKEAKA